MIILDVFVIAVLIVSSVYFQLSKQAVGFWGNMFGIFAIISVCYFVFRIVKEFTKWVMESDLGELIFSLLKFLVTPIG